MPGASSSEPRPLGELQAMERCCLKIRWGWHDGSSGRVTYHTNLVTGVQSMEPTERWKKKNDKKLSSDRHTCTPHGKRTYEHAHTRVHARGHTRMHTHTHALAYAHIMHTHNNFFLSNKVIVPGTHYFTPSFHDDTVRPHGDS